MTGAFSPWGRRCPRPRPRTDEGRACGCCPLKGDHANSALISRLRAQLQSTREERPSAVALRHAPAGAAPRGKPLELAGAFSPWGRRCPRPRPRTDEGRVCGCCPLKGRLRELRPHQPPAGGSFSLRAKSRLRRLRSDTRLRAQPLGRKPLEQTGAFSSWGRRCPRPRPRTDEGRACGGCPLKGGYANSALISRLRAAASPEGEAFRTGAAPWGKPLEMTGAFSPWGRRCPRPRPRTDEGRACGCCPLKEGYANSALISRLRAAASPEGEAFKE